ncbi:MAG: hypothetical protein WCQ41_07165 [Bacillota bacterium]
MRATISALLNEYEELFEEAFWEQANSANAERFEKINPEELAAILSETLKAWFSRANELVGGKTPLEYVKSLNEKDTIEFLKIIHVESSEVIKFYAPALVEKQDFLLNRFIESLKGLPSREEEALFLELSVLLAHLKDMRALNLFIKFIMDAPSEMADLVDFVQGLLGEYGADAKDKFLATIKNHSEYEGRIENIYAALSKIESESDDVFYALKQLFSEAPKKSFAAICFSVHGDVRALPILAEWAENVDASNYDKTEIGDVLAAIKVLSFDKENPIQ